MPLLCPQQPGQRSISSEAAVKDETAATQSKAQNPAAQPLASAILSRQRVSLALTREAGMTASPPHRADAKRQINRHGAVAAGHGSGCSFRNTVSRSTAFKTYLGSRYSNQT